MINTLGLESVEDPGNIERTFRALRNFQKGCCPSNLVLPLLPIPSRLRSIWAMMHIYRLVRQITGKREREGSVGQDVLQTLINEKTDVEKTLKVSWRPNGYSCTS
jgi:hypothetical protein